jgi:hypothetical protein
MAKRLILLNFIVAFVVLICATVSAQRPVQGLKVGLNLSKFTGEGVTGLEAKQGLIAGAYTRFDIEQSFSFQPEFLFSIEGAKERGYYNGYPYRIIYTLFYFDVPLLARINFTKQSAIKPYFLAGPVVGMRLFSKYSVEIQDESSRGTLGGINRYELGAAVGAGIDFELSKGYFGFDGRYTVSLLPISGGHLKNSSLTIIANYGY